MVGKSRLSIVIPVYGEENTIKEIIRKVDCVRYPLPHEIIVVNDGSKDETFSRIKEVMGVHSLKLVSYADNHGKGYAIREGIRACAGDVVIIQDADLEYDPSEIPSVIKPIIEGDAEVVYGSRFMGRARKISLLHYVGNRVLTWMTNVLFNTDLTDMETCYKAFSRRALDGILLTEDGFEVEPEITAELLKAGFRITEVSVSYSARGFREGKKITWRQGVKSGFVLLGCRFPLLRQFARDYPMEVVVRWLRHREVLREIGRGMPMVLDVGCGFDCLFLRSIGDRISSGYGFDVKACDRNFGNIHIRDFRFERALCYQDDFFDCITSMATFEHFENPADLAREFLRVLKRGGLVVLTVPTKKSKRLLDFLSGLRVLNPDEIRDHKAYYDPEDVRKIFLSAGFKDVKSRPFELGLNMLYVFEK